MFLFLRNNLLIGRKSFIARLVIWTMAEVLLNYMGLDNLADYSEFLFDKPLLVINYNYKISD